MHPPGTPQDQETNTEQRFVNDLYPIIHYGRMIQMQLKKKYVLFLAIALVSSVSTASALLVYMQTLTVTLVSLDSAVLITDMLDVPISDLGTLQLFIGETESKYFKVVNLYDNPITLTFEVTFTGTGFGMADGEIGVNPNGTGYVGLALGDPLVLGVGEYTEVGIAVGHTEPAIDPGMTVTINAE